MTEQHDDSKNAALRKRAEQNLQESGINAVDFSLDDAKKLIHELHVHHIELELQNEELLVTQLELEASRRRYSDLYEFSPVGLLTLDHDERIQEANLTFVTMLGIDREKLIKRNLSDFIDHSTQDTYHFFYQALHSAPQSQQCEIILLPLNKPPLVVKLDGTVLVHADTHTIYRIAVSDITERHESELEIKRLYSAEQAVRTLAEHTARRLASLQEITASLSRAISYEQIVEACVQQSIPIIGARSGDILLLSNDGSTLHAPGVYGGSEHPVALSLSDATPLAEALRLRKPIWIPSLEEYVLHYPQASAMTVDDCQAFAHLPLIVSDDPIGILSYSFLQPQTFTEEDQLFMQALAQQYAQAMARVRLSEQARDLATLQERQRLARDLHDGVKQSLFAATSMSEALPRLWDRDSGRAKIILAQVVTLNRSALAQMQGVLFELLPDSSVQIPLGGLLRQLSEAVRGHREITAELEIEGGEPTLPVDVHMEFYRIAQESLNNILKHSQATQFNIHLNNQPDQLTMTIHDNGCGFDSTDISAGMGLGIMQERAAIVHATLHITSSSGMGTEVKLLWKPATASTGVKG